MKNGAWDQGFVNTSAPSSYAELTQHILLLNVVTVKDRVLQLRELLPPALVLSPQSSSWAWGNSPQQWAISHKGLQSGPALRGCKRCNRTRRQGEGGGTFYKTLTHSPFHPGLCHLCLILRTQGGVALQLRRVTRRQPDGNGGAKIKRFEGREGKKGLSQSWGGGN